jgi:DNA-binding GntR family transcriptional regulator
MANVNVTYQQMAYDYVREKIITLGFKPGEYITDTGIASELKVSRTPVREAFYRLEKEGLLINDARRGWRVYTMTLKDIEEIFDLKEAIEGMIVRKAAACNDESLKNKLRECLGKMRDAAETGDTHAWFQADVNLHKVLFAMANNDRAVRIVTNLNDQWHRVRIGFTALMGRTRRSVAEHEEFVGAVLAGDGDQAERFVRQHLNQVREELVRLLVNVVFPFVEEGV